MSIFRSKPVVDQDRAARDFDHHGRLPKRQVRFCGECGSPVRWKRETPSFSQLSGNPGHSYHLACVNWGRLHWHEKKYKSTAVWYGPDPPPGVTVDLELHSGYGRLSPGGPPDCAHFNGEEYRWREGDQEFYEPEELW